MTKGNTIRMIFMLIIAAVVLGAVVAFQGFKNRMIAQSIQAQANPPQTVSTIVAQDSTWQPSVEALGSLVASAQSSLSAEVPGRVTAIYFDSGLKVQTGDSLVELNTAPLKAVLAQLEAVATLAELDLKRDEAQLEVLAVSQAKVDADRATLKSTQAQVAAQRAMIAQKTIVAPFSGQLGIRQVNLGQYLAAGTPVVTLQKLDPMEIDFTIPQSQIEIVRVGKTVHVATNAVPGLTFEAHIIAIEPQIDPSTRNVHVRARISNPRSLLLPGMFATVTIDEGPTEVHVTLPSAAVAYNPYGAVVFIVKEGKRGSNGEPELTVEQRFVTAGPTLGSRVAILSGIEPGETVVTSGQIKLRNGSRVVINNSVQPSGELEQSTPTS